jgi:hypothetical protein
LNEGDWVEVHDRRWRDGVLYTDRVYNHTTRSLFRIR